MQSIRQAYNTAAAAYRKNYETIAARTEDVDATISFVPKKNPLVLEIGCAYGREAVYFLTKTDQYIGIDICDEFIKMAQTEVPGGTFVCADVLEYDFPSNIDVVFAAASLLHLAKEDMAVVLQAVGEALAPGGVVFLSLKRRDSYQAEVVTDDITSRQFYYYTRDTLIELLPSGLVEVCYDEQERKEPWLTMILKKAGE